MFAQPLSIIHKSVGRERRSSIHYICYVFTYFALKQTGDKAIENSSEYVGLKDNKENKKTNVF